MEKRASEILREDKSTPQRANRGNVYPCARPVSCRHRPIREFGNRVRSVRVIPDH